MKIIRDFITNSSEADYYRDSDCDCDFDCDCDYDCDCDRDYDCDCDCDCDCDYDCDCDCDCTLSDYVNDYFDGNWDLYESNMDDDD